ncbi:MAG: gliding motility-associated C-terminal domain-containing protein, partial [Sphingobacteriaceae bacterium]|nr:gliding motility-associated C-terminal domain-containing protein [Cytophagaceae bacterium]
MPALLGCFLLIPAAFAQDLSGFWLGVTYPNDPQARIFNYTANFTQTGTAIGGTVQTADTNVVFGGLAYANGQFLRGILTYREQNQTGNQNDANTCYWDATLTYDPATESLKGTYVNILNPPYCSQAGGGNIELYRIRLKS